MKTRIAWLVVPFVALSLCHCECTPPSDQDSGPGADANGDGDTGPGHDARRDAGPGQDRHGTDILGTDAQGSDATGTDTQVNDAGGHDATEPDGSATVESCSGAPTTSAAAGDCEVVAGNTSTLIVGTVLTPGHVYQPGGVVYDSAGKITCIGCNCFAAASAARKIVCNDVVVSPGLINAHDHMGWMNDVPRSPVGPTGIRYEHRHDWRKGDPADHEPKITTAGGATTDDKIFGELRFVLGGATSINGSGNAPGLLRNLDQAGGLEGLTEGKVLYSTFPLGDSDGTLISDGCGYPSFDSASSVQAANAYTPHVSEGINDYAYNEYLCLSSTANGGHDLLGDNTAIIHGIGLSASAIDALAFKGAKLIWSPRSNIALYGETAAVTLYHRQGMPIALGTDWIPSGSMNMLRELACAAALNDNYYGHSFSDEELWRMVTIDAARATGMEASIGTLKVSALADIALFRVHTSDPFASVVRSDDDDMLLVMRGGKVLAGRDALVAALENNCDPVDVCGTQYRVCLQREVQKTFSALQTAVGQMYDLTSCGAPPDEPTCQPYRGSVESILGSSVYTEAPSSSDRDGDGIANGDDNCPDVFNPKRPFDHGLQGDADNDGVGDVCDRCPLDADTDQCTVFNPDDADRDGVLDTVDNCPGLANPPPVAGQPQTDTDGDGKGDACDSCPTVANPTGGCPTTIHQIQDTATVGHPAINASVSFDCAVTAVSIKGLWCQERAGGAYSGIYVYLNAEPLVVRGSGTAVRPLLGDDLHVDGVYVEYKSSSALTPGSLTEINSPTLTWVGAGAELAPAVVNAADVSTSGSLAEQYESVLIRVNNVTVTLQNADTGGDYDELEVTGNLRVDDAIYAELDNTYPVGTQFSALVGVLYYSFDNFKIEPRDAGDIMAGPATLARFSDSLLYARVGAALTATIPRSLYIEMTRAVDADTTINLTVTPGGIAQVPATVVISNGGSRAEVQVQGLTASATPAHIVATLFSDTANADVRVLADDAPAQVATLTPAAVTALVNSTTAFDVSLDLPAPAGGASIDLVAGTDVVGNLGAVQSPLVIPFNAMTGSFDFVAAGTPAVGSVSATLGHTESARVTVVDLSALTQDLSGWQLVQTDSAQTTTLPANTQVPIGGYVIIARNPATKAAFEAFWHVTLGSDVTFINAGGTGAPQINGAETYTIKRSGGVDVVDGPSIPLTAGKCYQRKLPVQTSNTDTSWTVITATPGSGPTPGSGQSLGSPPTGAYVSEYCDATGTGNFIYEFVEIYVDGPVQ